MSGAPKWIAERPASERMASEPDARPTRPFARVRQPEARTDPNATFSLCSCTAAPCRGRQFHSREIGGRFLQGLAIFTPQPRAEFRGRRHVVDAADALSRRPDVFP